MSGMQVTISPTLNWCIAYPPSSTNFPVSKLCRDCDKRKEGIRPFVGTLIDPTPSERRQSPGNVAHDLADIAVLLPNVRFTRESGHQRTPSSCPLSAISRSRLNRPYGVLDRFSQSCLA